MSVFDVNTTGKSNVQNTSIHCSGVDMTSERGIKLNKRGKLENPPPSQKFLLR